MPAIRQMRVSPDGSVWWPQVAAGGKSAADDPRPEDPPQTNAAPTGTEPSIRKDQA